MDLDQHVDPRNSCSLREALTGDPKAESARNKKSKTLDSKNVRSPFASRDLNVPLPRPHPKATTASRAADSPHPLGVVEDAYANDENAPAFEPCRPPPRPPTRWADDVVNAAEDDDFERWLDSIAPPQRPAPSVPGDDREQPSAQFLCEASCATNTGLLAPPDTRNYPPTPSPARDLDQWLENLLGSNSDACSLPLLALCTEDEVQSEAEEETAQSSSTDDDGSTLSSDDREFPSAPIFCEASRAEESQPESEEDAGPHEGYADAKLAHTSKPRFPKTARQPLDSWLGVSKRFLALKKLGRFQSRPNGPAETAVQALLTISSLDVHSPTDRLWHTLERLTHDLKSFNSAATERNWAAYKGSKCKIEFCTGLEDYDDFCDHIAEITHWYHRLVANKAHRDRFTELAAEETATVYAQCMEQDAADLSSSINTALRLVLQLVDVEADQRQRSPFDSDTDEEPSDPADVALYQAMDHIARKQGGLDE